MLPISSANTRESVHFSLMDLEICGVVGLIMTVVMMAWDVPVQIPEQEDLQNEALRRAISEQLDV